MQFLGFSSFGKRLKTLLNAFKRLKKLLFGLYFKRRCAVAALTE